MLYLSVVYRFNRAYLPVPANANRKEQTHFISECGPCAEDFKILSMLIPHVASRQSREKISRCDRRALMKNSPVRPPSKRFLTGLKTLYIDSNKFIIGWNPRMSFPFAASSVGSPPAQLSAALRVLRFALALRVCWSCTQPTGVVARGKNPNCRVFHAPL